MSRTFSSIGKYHIATLALLTVKKVKKWWHHVSSLLMMWPRKLPPWAVYGFSCSWQTCIHCSFCSWVSLCSFQLMKTFLYSNIDIVVFKAWNPLFSLEHALQRWAVKDRGSLVTPEKFYPFLWMEIEMEQWQSSGHGNCSSLLRSRYAEKYDNPYNRSINSLTPSALHNVTMWNNDNKNNKTWHHASLMWAPGPWSSQGWSRKTV